ncbi:MAG: GSCFA domain-containing protein [Flavipsychrobacter sp.]|nr:GSCFA domain-containing protein [Flavipsychrobacter sp.]
MQLTLQLDIRPLADPITYTDSILLTGSCFTEHMADRLSGYKFRTLSNPNGILFNPLSVADSLDSYIERRTYAPEDLFYLNEVWNSWHHHSRYSNIDPNVALDAINQSQEEAADFILEADWVIITLGTAFQYYLKETGLPVSNNHRAPAQWFNKRLLEINEIEAALANTIQRIYDVNPGARIIFTISPVRHVREGVMENNRSKARLIEAVHTLCSNFAHVAYFPAYELLIDILRDYRYYDIDFVHPNYLATTYIWEQFVAACVNPGIQDVMQEVLDIITARMHRPRFPQTEAHKKFKADYTARITNLLGRHPFLDLREELKYFSE